MSQQTYVFRAELMGCEGVRRTILVRDDLTLVDLHYALQSAFGWDDDQLYSFWLHGTFWGAEDQHYTHPYHAASRDPRGRSAVARLDELALTEGQRIAYVFDFWREQRVTLELREIRAGGGRPLARCIERVGAAPPMREDLLAPEPPQDRRQATIEFVALMSEEGDAA
jgi:hypothetical protein